MNDLTMKSFDMTRRFFLRVVENVDEAVIDVQPSGFNNTIHWQIGHVLTVTEQFMFGFPKKSTNLPENYVELFGNGTKPSDWTEGVPGLDVLILQLKEQGARLQEIPPESFHKPLNKPFLGFETFGELANMALYHEANHLGQIQSMNKIASSAILNK